MFYSLKKQSLISSYDGGLLLKDFHKSDFNCLNYVDAS